MQDLAACLGSGSTQTGQSSTKSPSGATARMTCAHTPTHTRTRRSDPKICCMLWQPLNLSPRGGRSPQRVMCLDGWAGGTSAIIHLSVLAAGVATFKAKGPFGRGGQSAMKAKRGDFDGSATFMKPLPPWRSITCRDPLSDFGGSRWSKAVQQSRRTESCYKYGRQVLLDIGKSEFCRVLDFDAGTSKELGLLRPEASPGSSAIPPPVGKRRKRCARRLKRGKRGDVRARLAARLAASPARPAVPSILLANVRSLDNKMDDIRLLQSTNRTVRDCCVLVFTETWLTVNIPDSAVHLERLACYRADRAIVQGGKSRGGGICVYIRDEWCRDSVVVCEHCSPLAELVIIKCRPFYLPREFTAILLVAVYIPPSNIEGDRVAALSEL
ncbi:uncharacterized protein ACBT44_013447 isoform 2-T5 [Syngnathus typhle]